jgi:hypothetical protein
MLRGTVKFWARIVDTERQLTIPQICEFNPNKTGVEKVEVEGPNGSEIIITVHISAVENKELGIATASGIHTEILDSISFYRDIAIENGRAENNLSPVDRQNNTITPNAADLVLVADHVKLSFSVSSADLKPILEEAALTKSRYFPFYRSARLSRSPVEEYMHLYNILLMLFDDEQAEIERFIFTQEPGVQWKYRPELPREKERRLKGQPVKPVKETVYTRLRNEFGHKREDVNLDDTKAEMTKCLSALRTLTKQAVELRS